MFYVYFLLCLLSIVLVEAADRLRTGQRAAAAVAAERTVQVLVLVGILAATFAAWQAIAGS